MCSPFMLQRFAQLHMEMEKRPTILASTLSTRPVFMVSDTTCRIVDTDGMRYTVAGLIPKFDGQPVSQWWSQLKLYVDTPCPQFETLRESLTAIKQKPAIQWFDNGVRDGCGHTFYGVFGEDTWQLGGDCLVVSDPAIHTFISTVCDVFNIPTFMIGSDLRDLHHPTIRCTNKHPMVELSQIQVIQREAQTLFHGEEPHYTHGYDCSDCYSHETESVVLHCWRCRYDLCPKCVAKRMT
jgi:hypothetical protein